MWRFVLGVSHKSGPIAQLAWLGKGPPLTLVPEYILKTCEHNENTRVTFLTGVRTDAYPPS